MFHFMGSILVKAIWTYLISCLPNSKARFWYLTGNIAFANMHLSLLMSGILLGLELCGAGSGSLVCLIGDTSCGGFPRAIWFHQILLMYGQELQSWHTYTRLLLLAPVLSRTRHMRWLSLHKFLIVWVLNCRNWVPGVQQQC